MQFLADVTLVQLVAIVALAAVSAVAGGVAGYGTGALMPLVLVPIVGAAPGVPIIAISAMFTNTARVAAFRRLLDRRRAAIALLAALPTCILGAWLYTLLTGRGAALVIGSTLIATVPLRRLLKHHGHNLGDNAYAAAAAGWGIVVGGTTGAGVILLSLLMASGLEGAAVIATDAVISLATSLIKISVFGLAGVVTAQVLAFAILIGAVALPGAFLARAFVERMPLHIHTAILDVAVIAGGMVMIWAAARQLV